ncbi:uncharacterized protein PV07_04736 [Cladophialophora immunda]|uniref:Uncharacterized protein n=1 Tax=Cladophialophora immunda TaxID=569365 RepID=A0A0D1ZLP1_9EURO|nr:uncharacterized protein PV07_04736 [Cladophialophora immunda]KIW28881.1 hypothetical protein PV07_04736 [Cladophialophora immunda]
MLFKKGAEVAMYETLFQDQVVPEIRCLQKERIEEEAWAQEKKEKQLDSKRVISAAAKWERDRKTVRKKRIATEQQIAIARSREQEKMTGRREAQKRAQQSAKERANKLTTARKVVEEEARTERARSERHEATRRAWLKLRKDADQRPSNNSV